jgi:hypothetical protein
MMFRTGRPAKQPRNAVLAVPSLCAACGLPKHFQAKWLHLAARKMRPDKAFSSQVASLGGSENATRQSIFKPSGFTWRLGKCDQTKHFQAKWLHLATRKMRPNKAFSSQVESPGDPENAVKPSIFKPIGRRHLSPLDQRSLKPAPPAPPAQRLPFAPGACLP